MILSLPPGWGTPIGRIAPYHLALLAAMILGAVLFTIQMRRIRVRLGTVLASLPLVVAIPVAAARLLDTAVYAPHLFETPFKLLEVLSGGLSSHGAFLGLAILCWILSRLYHVHPGDVADRLVFWGLAGAAGARVGDHVHAQGVGVPSDLPFAMEFDRLADGIPRHPTNLYELTLIAVLLVAGGGLLRRLGRNRPGTAGALAACGYFAGRFPIDALREVPLLWESPRIPVAHVLSAVMAALFAVAAFYFAKGALAAPAVEREQRAEARTVTLGKKILFVAGAAVISSGAGWAIGYATFYVRFTTGRALATFSMSMPFALLLGVPLFLLALGASEIGGLLARRVPLRARKAIAVGLLSLALILTFGGLVFLPMALCSLIVVLFAAALPFFRSLEDLVVYLVGGGAMAGALLIMSRAGLLTEAWSVAQVLISFGFAAVLVGRAWRKARGSTA